MEANINLMLDAFHIHDKIKSHKANSQKDGFCLDCPKSKKENI